MLKYILALLLLAPIAVWSDSDQNRSRMAVQAGEIMPLRLVLEQVEKVHPGQVLEVELEHEHGHKMARMGVAETADILWIYEIKMLNKDGRLQKLLVDAKTGEVIGIKQRDRSKRGPMHARPDR